MKSERKIREKIEQLKEEQKGYSSRIGSTSRSRIHKQIRLLEWVLED